MPSENDTVFAVYQTQEQSKQTVAYDHFRNVVKNKLSKNG
jgi:hypothetical protein